MRKNANRIVLLSILSIFLIGTVISCKSKRKRAGHTNTAHQTDKRPLFDEDDLTDAIISALQPSEIPDSTWAKKKLHTTNEMVQHVYQVNNYQPLWLYEDGDTTLINALFNDLEDMRNDGLDPEIYGLSKLRSSLAAINNSKDLELQTLLNFDTACTHSYIQASRDLLLGKVLPKQADSLWFHANDSVWKVDETMRTEMTDNGKYYPLDSFRSKLPTYALLRSAIKQYQTLAKDSAFVKLKQTVAAGANLTDSLRDAVILAEVPWVKESAEADTSVAGKNSLLTAYQRYYAIKATGKLDSATKACLSRPVDSILPLMYVNMERMRWMQQSFDQLYVLVDIPLMELFIRKNGENMMHMEVVVGKKLRQTPSLNAKMANVVINPPWGVPPTILKKDVLPGVLKSGAGYLARKGLKVYDFKGNRVDASAVNASNYKRYVFRQDPGDDNALGYVKFNLPNKWDIYLHDTPHREDFGKSDRAKSSGCIRVQQPREMAEYILTELEGKRYPMSRIDSVIDTHKTRYEVLANKIPVHIIYLTTFEDANAKHIRFVKDVYNKDNRLAALLK